MASVTINAPSGGFLYSNSRNARLIITAETPEFDREFVEAWLKEGFNVVYVPYSEDEKEYARRLTAVKEGLSVGDNYGIIAFGDAAAFCLEYYLKPNNVSRLCALVCYYPTSIPDIRSHYPQTVRILTHLAGEVIDVITTPTVLGLQGKKKRTTRQINPGIGVGEQLEIGHRAYTYSESEPGFAEVDQEEYNRLDADLAFTRSLEMLRRAYGQDRDLEKPWEEHLQGKFFSLDLDDTMQHYTKNLTPTVTYAPTLSGGTGARALRRFYDKYFLQKLPPSMRLRLISRTTGADRVVDEIYISFEHTQEVPWMLPGVPPTNKRVEIVVVSIVSLRAKQLYSEHIYWDQASVLVQLGLLDPKLVPQGVQGVDRLPVIGRESARRILNEDPEVDEPEFHNRLIIRGKKRRESKSSSATKSQLQSPAPSETESPNMGKQAGAQNGEESKEESREESREETIETSSTQNYEKSHVEEVKEGQEEEL